MSRSILNRSPLYVQIKQHILGDIRQGVWKPGEKLPTELDLAEGFGVSVGTVRRAMGGLEDEGIISRSRQTNPESGTKFGESDPRMAGSETEYIRSCG